MNATEDASKEKIANTVNAAIDGVLEEGPSESALEAWKSTIRDVLVSETTQEADAVLSVERYHQDLFESIRKNRGLSVRLVISDVVSELNDKSLENFSDAELEAIVQSLSGALLRSIAVARESAGAFKEYEIQSSLASFEDWASTVPAGGTKDKSYRAAARSVRSDVKSTASWARRFLIVHQTDFMSEAKHIFACNRGAIAGKWSLSKYPACALHGDLSGKIYLLRNSWAIQRGLLNTVGIKYFDEVPVPGGEGCCCSYVYLYVLRALPDSIIATRGREAMLAGSSNANEGLSTATPKRRWWHRIFSK